MSTIRTGMLPVAIGKADPQTNLAGELGLIYESGGKIYRLVKASGAISACANKVLVTTIVSSAVSWLVAATTSASSALVAGVVVNGQVGSDGTTGLLDKDYFMIQIAGVATPLVHTTALAAGTCLITATTSGTGDTVSATYAATTNGTIFARLLAASSGTDGATLALLQNLF